jgi:polyferredoxin
VRNLFLSPSIISEEAEGDRQMKSQTLRTGSRILLMLLTVLHLVTWYALGIRAVGSIGIEAAFSGLSRGVLNAGLVFWILVFLSALLFGRAFCGWFCWFGGYLELVEWGIGDKLRVKLPRSMLLYLAVIPFIALFAKIYGSLLVNWLNRFPAAFSFNLADTEPWAGQQTGMSILITLVLYGPVLLFVFGRRAWCRYLCPLGALVKTFARFGIGKVRLVSDACNGCGKCNLVCDMRVDVAAGIRSDGEVDSADCIRCLKCADACPARAIAFRMRRPAGVSLSAESAGRLEKVSLRRRSPSALDVSVVAIWTAISLFFTFVARQGAPQEIKIAMAAGLLLVIYFAVLSAQNIWGRIRGRGRGATQDPS